MASAIPLALSLLQTLATQYPGSQKAQPAPASIINVPPPPPPPAIHSIPMPSSKPLNISAASTTTASAQASSLPSSNTIATTPPATKSHLCENCHLRPKYFDGTKTHPYCTKSCAKAIANGASANNGSTAAASGKCEVCHMRPKFNDGTRTHPYCGKACATKQNNSSQSKGPTSGNPTAKGACQAPGCGKPAFANSNGTPGDYCSMAHKTLVECLCLLCRQAPKLANSHFCSKTCTDDAEQKGPTILEVPNNHVTFRSVSDQFKASWRHTGTTCPPVKRIYKILAPQASLASYNAYRAGVETRGQFVASGRSAGNENRRWHGTRRECNLGDKGQTQFCGSSSCSLCCIVKTSFDLSLWGKKTGWGRFGKGIYTSSTSSKANDYSSNDCKSPLKAILLNKVVVGKGCKMLHDTVTLTSPPSGYDSVLAEKGGSLNYDELVVYSNDAIRPSFLVMYEP